MQTITTIGLDIAKSVFQVHPGRTTAHCPSGASRTTRHLAPPPAGHRAECVAENNLFYLFKDHSVDAHVVVSVEMKGADHVKRYDELSREQVNVLAYTEAGAHCCQAAELHRSLAQEKRFVIGLQEDAAFFQPRPTLFAH